MTHVYSLCLIEQTASVIIRGNWYRVTFYECVCIISLSLSVLKSLLAFIITTF